MTLIIQLKMKLITILLFGKLDRQKQERFSELITINVQALQQDQHLRKRVIIVI